MLIGGVTNFSARHLILSLKRLKSENAGIDLHNQQESPSGLSQLVFLNQFGSKHWLNNTAECEETAVRKH